MATATSSIAQRPAETSSGTVTSWVAASTPFPSAAGCVNALISARDGDLTGWDPGYAITVDASVKCWPDDAKAWWEQEDPRTTISLGPVECPEAYYTATTSARNEESTLVACCPSGYAYNTEAPIAIVAPGSQCVSTILEDQFYEYASDFGGSFGWLKTYTTATTPTTVLGVPFNGWQFNLAMKTEGPVSRSRTSTAASQTSSSVDAAISEIASSSGASSLTHTAKVGIGVGVGVGVILIVALLLWIFLDPLARLRHRRNADRVEAASRAQGRGPSPPLGPPTPPSLRNLAVTSPLPPMSPNSIGPGAASQLSPLSSGTMSMSSSVGLGHNAQEMTDILDAPSAAAVPASSFYRHDNHHPFDDDSAAPPPVVAGVGINRNRSSSSQSRQHQRYRSQSSNITPPRPNHSAGEWVAPRDPRPASRSASQQSYNRMNTTVLQAHGRTRTTSQSTTSVRSVSRGGYGPGVGIWGIDPTGRGGRGNSIDTPSIHSPAGVRHQTSSSSMRVDKGKGKAPMRERQDSDGAGEGTNVGQELDRSTSQRSARIVMSPVEMAGERYGMVMEV